MHVRPHLTDTLVRYEWQATVLGDGARKAGERVVKLLEEANAGTLSRNAWELRVKQFMVEGHVRRCR